jgi:hypothetical protein
MMHPTYNRNEAIDALRAYLQSDLTRAAEPIIKKAVDEFEKELRAKTALRVMTIIDKSFEISTGKDVLTIRVDYSNDGGRR